MPVHLEGEVPSYDGCVLSEQPWYYRVPSDNAMIDSGIGRLVEVWDHGLGAPQLLEFHLGRPGARLHVTVDAPAELQERALRYKQVSGWMSTCFDNARAARVLQVGKTVTVDNKCRKVPASAGVCTVTTLGTGQYGDYAHLKDASGNHYTYVDRRWLTVVDPAAYLVTPCPFGGADELVCALVRDAALGTGEDPGLWLIVAARLEELGHPAAPHVRAVAAVWALNRVA